jgi:dTDP-glucose pyrophosphorylase
MQQLKKIKQITIHPSATIIEALKQMDAIEKKLLLVLSDNQFVSLLSIGDIQRAIIAGKDLTTPVAAILRKDILVAHINQTIEEVHQLIQLHRMEFMPVLSGNNQIHEIIFWEDVFQEAPQPEIKNDFTCPMVIMAGGQGSRLKPITNIIPKPLIPLGEKPIMEWIIESFYKLGSRKFYASVNYKKEMIKQYFDDLNFDIDYFVEEKPLGTAGSLHLLLGKLNETFFVSNCDILIKDDYQAMLDFHKQNKNDLTAVAVVKNYEIPYGTLETTTDGILTDMREKPSFHFLVNAGMYILEPHVLNDIPHNEFFHITELMLKLKNENKRVGVYPVSEGSWFDIGEWDKYNDSMRRLGLSNMNVS